MHLPLEVIQQLKERKTLIDQQELILSALKLELVNFIRQVCDVDVESGGYVIDLERGTLENADDTK